MQTSQIEDKIRPFLEELNVKGIEEIVEDYLLTEILARIHMFKSEINFFERKYNKPFEKLREEYEGSEENFEIYDDLMAWEFAIDGFSYWTKKLEEFKKCFAR